MSKSLRERCVQVVDFCLPAEILNGSVEDLRRGRMVVGFSFLVGFFAFEEVIFFRWAMPAEVAPRIGLTFAATLLAVALVPLVLRRTGRPEAGGALVSVAAYLSTVGIVSVLGGIHSQVLHWFAVIPLVSALMGSRRGSLFWSGMAALAIAGYLALDVAGVHVPNHLALGSRSEFLWMQRVIDVGSWMAILLMVSNLYERHTQKQTTALQGKNDELQREIVQRNRAEERTQYLAYYDDLTALPNRRLFKERLTHSMELALRSDWSVAVLFLDLDGFKEVNDTLGHGFGDQLLQTVGERLRGCIRSTDSVSRGPETAASQTVSRLGGDEFTILLEGVRDHIEVAVVAGRVLGAVEKPVVLDDNEVFISASIGIALYPGSAGDMETLLRNADLAMYHAKDHGKHRFEFFEESMNEDIVRRTSITAELRRGVEAEEFVLHFQPIIETSTGQIEGVETLVRWQHPTLGLMGPVEFIDVAEHSGLIVPMGQWILMEACRTHREWRRQGLAPGRIAVNVSGMQFRRGNMVELVEQALERFDMQPDWLELEVTESAMMLDEDEASRQLEQLARLGVRIALDDFGTGFSSLSYVKRFPVDSLKIDRSFVRDIETDEEAQAISMAIIAMAHQLGLRVVAEGVETRAQEDFLRSHGCDALQGFRFGRPVVAKEIGERLAQEPGAESDF